MVNITTLKKTIALSVASLLMLLGCTGCLNYSEPVDYTDQVPEELSALYEKLGSVLSEWGYDDYTLAEIETPADTEKLQYVIKILTEKNKADPPTLSFFLKNDKLRTSYTLIYNNSNTAGEFKELYAAVFKLVDDSLTKEEAEALADEMVASYNGDGISKVMKLSGYKLFLHPADQSAHPWLEVKDEDELWIAMENELEDYKTFDYETFSSPKLANRELMKLTGTVDRLEWELSGIIKYYYVNLYVIDEAGYEYKVVYCYTGTPVDFEIGKIYDFYGITVNEAEKENGVNNLQLEYAEYAGSGQKVI